MLTRYKPNSICLLSLPVNIRPVALRTHTEVRSIGKEIKTNLWNTGRISADRRTKPTLMLTIPCPKVKSSTKDLSLPIFEIMIQYLQ